MASTGVAPYLFGVLAAINLHLSIKCGELLLLKVVRLEDLGNGDTFALEVLQLVVLGNI